jgi:hypothetical protein
MDRLRETTMMARSSAVVSHWLDPARRGRTAMPRTSVIHCLLLGAALAGCSNRPSASSSSSSDTTPPSLTSRAPAASATGVSVNTSISAQFSEAMKTTSVSIALSPSATLTGPGWSAGDTTATATPAAPLAADTVYTVTVSGQDLAGNPLPATSWTFRTAASASLAGVWDSSSWDAATWQ